MKKTLLAAAVMISGAAMAQNEIVPSTVKLDKGTAFSQKTPTDTLVFDFLDNGVALYTIPETGYAFGTNGRDDSYNIQGYVMFEEGYNVEGAYVWAGYKNDSIWSGDSVNSKITFGVFNLDQNNAIPVLPPVTTQDLLFVDTKGATSSEEGFFGVLFDSPAWVSFDYGIGIDFRGLAEEQMEITTDTAGNADTLFIPGDSLGIVSTEHGFGGGANYNWYVNANTNAVASVGSFYTVGGSAIDLNFLILPIIEYNASIEEASFIQGLKTEVFPNPVVNNATIKFELEAAGDVMVEIFSLNGQHVVRQDLGYKAAGTIHTTNLDVSSLPAGTYVYAVTSGKNRISKKLIIQ